MPHHDKVILAGVIGHVFAHRFTVDTGDSVHLADLGPKGLEVFSLEPGLAVTIEGERRPSEIKVVRIAKKGGPYSELEHKRPHHPPRDKQADIKDSDASADAALAAARKAGWTVTGSVDRKPKHYEVLARKGKGEWTELHIDFSGNIYKEKVADQVKWSIE
ncbi:hypothetical protein [Luteibacter yeojuensis]|uniref:Uncharacterized protein n=1 Tax=Luteibacter yeojuensis TaxID=345309 RepID=A0A0F3KU17_9GAMM|nr:hypothetical protein [Luteibacter yeojuensis]KJV34760.1 hypothetical protein VI08_09225 [Luteibacter yeojuensis]